MSGALGEVDEPTAQTGLRGLFGRPFVALDDLLDLSDLEALHDEICLALAQLPTSYTGGSHRSMGIIPGGREPEALVDYQEVIGGLDDDGFATFRDLADDPSSIDSTMRRDLAFGEERALPLSTRQMLWLKMRHRVYFPWKVYAELIPNRTWEDKNNPRNKEFTRASLALLPKTIAFVKRMPFQAIGRCNIMGLEGHDHGTVHRDGDPDEQRAPDHFITFCPMAGKRVYVFDPVTRRETILQGRAYWFNDNDYHGVLADPFFRYSVRVDGVFTRDFLDRMTARFGCKP